MKDWKNDLSITCRVNENLMQRINDNKARIKNKYSTINNFYKIAIEKEFCEFVNTPYDKDVELLNLKKELKQIKKDIAEILKEKFDLHYYSQQIKYAVDNVLAAVKLINNNQTNKSNDDSDTEYY